MKSIAPMAVMVLAVSCAASDILQESFFIKLKQMKEDYEEVIETQNNTIENLRVALGEYNQTIQEHGLRLNQLTDWVETEVAFWVQLGQIETITQNDIVKFNEVKTNVGGGYVSDPLHPNYGKFIAPVAGTYQFILTTLADAGPDLFGRIMKGSDSQCNALSNGEDDTGTCGINLKVQAGEEVYVKSINNNNVVWFGRYCRFSGFLIHKDT